MRHCLHAWSGMLARAAVTCLVWRKRAFSTPIGRHVLDHFLTGQKAHDCDRSLFMQSLLVFAATSRPHCTLKKPHLCSTEGYAGFCLILLIDRLLTSAGFERRHLESSPVRMQVLNVWLPPSSHVDRGPFRWLRVRLLSRSLRGLGLDVRTVRAVELGAQRRRLCRQFALSLFRALVSLALTALEPTTTHFFSNLVP